MKRLLTVMMCAVIVSGLAGCGKRADKERPAPAAIPAPPLKTKTPLAGAAVARQQLPMTEPLRETALKEGEILVCDFEGWPNNLGGEMGVYGSLEPDWDKANLYPVSWVYDPFTSDYDPQNVHAGKSSFRLVTGLGAKPDLEWGSFSMDLGPTTDLTVVPKKVESLDVTGYMYLTFWAKGVNGGEKMELLLRDSHALNYNPQIKYKLPVLKPEWEKIVVSLNEFRDKIDFSKLDNVGVAFGKDAGNATGDVAYIDDFVFTNNP